MSRDTDVYVTLCSVTFCVLRNMSTIIRTIQIRIIIVTTEIPKPLATRNVNLFPAVSFSGYLLEVLVSVAKFVVSSVVVASVEVFVVVASVEVFVDSVGAEEDGDVWSGGVSVGVTLQFRSEYISTL